MSVPLRKEHREELTTEELTTADLAQSKRPIASQDQPTPVLAPRSTSERSQTDASDGQNPPGGTPLFPNNELDELRSRWSAVQTAFVDEPRRAVEQADGLVASAMKRLAEVFAEERSRLEKQWDRGDDVSTEDLRIALQRYRTFFQRLLAI